MSQLKQLTLSSKEKMSRRKLSDIEKADTARLQAVWNEKGKALHLTQVAASKIFGFKNQSAVSQYLNGRIPVNMAIAAKFADLLSVPLSAISPRFSTASSDSPMLRRLLDSVGGSDGCQLLEADAQALAILESNGPVMFIVDPDLREVSGGIFTACVQGTHRLLNFVPHKDAYHVLGLSDDGGHAVVSKNAASLISVSGRVIAVVKKCIPPTDKVPLKKGP